MRLTFRCVVWLVLGSSLALGQATEKVLYSFGGYEADGVYPNSSFVADGAGNLYGTTTLNGICSGCSVIYELSPNSNGTWSESVLYTFSCDYLFHLCPDGAMTFGGLAIDKAGNLYGTTYFGGVAGCPFLAGNGCGVAFELSPPGAVGGSWTYTVIYNFCSVGADCQDGAGPVAPLTINESGNLYGTTFIGGQNQIPDFTDGAGTVFELSRSSGVWTESVLYNFCSVQQGSSCLDGYGPGNALTIDAAGNLYSSAYYGGNPGSAGVLFKLSQGTNGWTDTVLRQIVIEPDLDTYQELGPLSLDPEGNLYTTFTFFDRQDYSDGFVAKLSPNGGGTQFRFNGTNGRGPRYGVILDSKRDLYGVTAGSSEGPGNAFQIDARGTETVLYNFCQQDACSDGSSPSGGLYEDGLGNLFGATAIGGTYGYGTVFEITP